MLEQQKGDTALMWASEKGHTATVQLLLKAKARVNLTNKASCFINFMACGRRQCAISIGSFYPLNACVIIVWVSLQMGETALMFASSGGHIATVHVLLQAHAEVAVQDWVRGVGAVL